MQSGLLWMPEDHGPPEGSLIPPHAGVETPSVATSCWLPERVLFQVEAVREFSFSSRMFSILNVIKLK